MKLRRRELLHLAAGAVALPAVTRIARAQTYPSRPVHVIVGLPPGNSGDIVARLMGQWPERRLSALRDGGEEIFLRPDHARQGFNAVLTAARFAMRQLTVANGRFGSQPARGARGHRTPFRVSLQPV